MKRLKGNAKIWFENDLVLSHMLMVEFGTHPYTVGSSVKLCNLVCDFFAPLLVKTKMALPVKLLQFHYNKLLTQRLCSYNNDTKSKVYKNKNLAFGNVKILCAHVKQAILVRVLTTLVEQNSHFMQLQLQKEKVDLEAHAEARNLESYIHASKMNMNIFALFSYYLTVGPEWQLLNNLDEVDTWSEFDVEVRFVCRVFIKSQFNFAAQDSSDENPMEESASLGARGRVAPVKKKNAPKVRNK
jgi:hypothetical protein